MAHKLSRRDVLKASAATAVGLALPGISSASPSRMRSDAIRFAIVGVGGKGQSGTEEAAKLGEIVALCDVDAETRAKGLLLHPRASTFDDYRRMFDTMHKEFDAVVVSTPDHNHAPASAMAMRHGKHVYCEKPLTRTLFEARKLQQIARDEKVATQMGNQLSAHPELRKAVAVIRSGAIGAAKEVHCWTDRPSGWWPQGVERPATKAAPVKLDWDLWIGPSPERPFAEGYHPFAWRGWWDFGSGSLGDMGCHCMNMPFRALDLREPIAVQAETSGHNRDSFPAWSIVHYEFAERRGRPPVTLTWYDGGKRPPQDLAPGVAYGGNGCLVVCEKATLYSPTEYGAGGYLLGGAPMPDVPFEESPGHFPEWANAILGGKPASSSIPETSGPLTETVLLGNLAIWASGQRIEWDSRRLRVRGGQDGLEDLIKPRYRRGWEL